MATVQTSAIHYGALDWIAMTLLIIGGLNWGLVGFLNIDLVATLFGSMTLISSIIYILVGLAAIYAIVMCTRMARH